MKNSLLDFKHIRFSFHYGMRLRPMRDWFILLALLVLLLLISVVWNAWYYESVRGEASAIDQSPTAAPVFSQASVTQIQAIFADRANEEAKYQDHSYTFIDPSK